MATKNKVKDVNELFNMADFENRWFKPEDFPTQVLILIDVTKKTGNRGDYYLMTCKLEVTGEQVEVSTGATQPTAFIRTWLEVGKPPVRFSFHFEGQRILISNPHEVGYTTDMFPEDEPNT